MASRGAEVAVNRTDFVGPDGASLVVRRGSVAVHRRRSSAFREVAQVRGRRRGLSTRG